MNLSNADKSRVLEELENCRLEVSRKVTFYAGYGRAQRYRSRRRPRNHWTNNDTQAREGGEEP